MTEGYTNPDLMSVQDGATHGNLCFRGEVVAAAAAGAVACIAVLARQLTSASERAVYFDKLETELKLRKNMTLKLRKNMT